MTHLFMLTLLALLCATACAKRPMLADPAAPLSTAQQADTSPRLEPGLYDGKTGALLTLEQVVTRLSGARYIMLGETHDDAFHHRVQDELYAALTRRAEREGHAVLLGMEMFQAPFQAHLDAYMSGDMDQARMLELTEWETRWRFPVKFYEPLWQRARAQGYPIVALNAPREISRRVSQVGLDGLTPEERRQVAPELDLEVKAHRAWFSQMFASHDMQDEVAQGRFYEAQVTWDETMAWRAVEALKARPEADQMVIIAGSGHVMNRWGIPGRVERRVPGASVMTLIPVSAPASSRGLKRPTGATQRDLQSWIAQDFADIIWVQ